MKTRLQLALTLLSLGFLVAAAPASAILYGDFFDPSGTVSFLNVSDINGLYGGPLDGSGNPVGPTVSLNSLDFTPINFDQTCSNCPGGGTTTDTITFEIDAVTGQSISTIDIFEAGNFATNAFGTGSFATVTISAAVTIDIFEVNGTSVSNISDISQLNFVFGTDPFASANTSVSGLYTGSLSIDLNAILAANGFGAGSEATRIQLSMDNTLTAFHSGLGGSAMIRKRDFDSTVITINGGAPVPEPSTALLILGGLTALSARRARTR